MAQITINAHASSGHILGRNAAWATARGLATGTSVSDGFIGAELTGGNYDIYRGFFQFDLSALAGSTIAAADFKIYLDSKDTSSDFSIATQAHTVADATNLTTAEFDALTVDTPTEYSARSAVVSSLSTGAYLTLSLNGTALAAMTGNYFKIACRSTADVDNSSPAARSYFGYQTDAQANPPQLVVTYTPAGGQTLSTAYFID
jgi:hypothetical protein